MDKRERIHTMKKEAVDTSYSAIKDYENRLENHFGVQTELRYTGFFDWGALSKRNVNNPYSPTGGTSLVPVLGGLPEDRQLKLSFDKCNRILDFGSSDGGTSEGYMREYAREYYTLDTDPRAQTDFSDLKEKLIFKIIEAVESNGSDFAFPSQSIYVENQS